MTKIRQISRLQRVVIRLPDRKMIETDENDQGATHTFGHHLVSLPMLVARFEIQAQNRNSSNIVINTCP